MIARKQALPRVCFVIPTLEVGGTERQLLYLMRGLVADHELTVVCTRYAGALVGEARRLGAFVRELDGRGGWDFTQRLRIRRAFRAHRPDVVHSFLFGFDLAANRAARETNVPVVISSRRELATWKKGRHLRVQHRANALVDCIVANSHAAANFAIEQERANPALFKIIHNGIDADAFVSDGDPGIIRERFKLPPSGPIVGMVANFSPVKDHDLLLGAVEILAKRKPDVQVLLVGEGPQRGAVSESIRRRGLADRVRTVSTFEELPDLYRIMDLVVLTSRVEGFPNVLLEAMAARKPVVASAVGGIPELIEDGNTGRLVASREPGEFAEAMAWLLEHEDERNAMGERASGHVRAQFSVDRMVAAHRALYRDLLVQSMRRGA